jgi:antitoxin VapB
MSLNIKNPETHRLAQELADLTGQSMAAAVADALREKLERERRKGLADRLVAIGRDCAAHLSEDAKRLNIDELLYDENGLPK